MWPCERDKNKPMKIMELCDLSNSPLAPPVGDNCHTKLANRINFSGRIIRTRNLTVYIKIKKKIGKKIKIEDNKTDEGKVRFL